MNRAASQNAARNDAISKTPQYVEPIIQQMMQIYQNESEAANPEIVTLVKKVMTISSNMKLTSAQIKKQQTILTEDNRYVTYIQIMIPRKEIEMELYIKIRKEQTLYIQFKASQTFMALENDSKNQ